MTSTPAPVTDNPWLHPLAPSTTPSPSEQLLQAIEAHLATESGDADACRTLAQRSPDPQARLLLSLIVDDAQRHSSLLRLMMEELNQDLDFIPLSKPVEPDGELTDDSPVARDAAVRELRALIRDQQEGSRHLRYLAHREPMRGGGLYPLLLETIARDADKGSAILRYVLHRIEA